MATEVVAGRLGEIRATSTVSGGSALTTTASFIEFPALTNLGENKSCQLFLTPRNFNQCQVARFVLNPWLTILKTTDNMVVAPTDYSLEAQDDSTSTSVTLDSLGTVANGDWVLLGSEYPIRGFYVTIGNTNSTPAVTATVSYRRGHTWVSTGATDGTSSSTALDQSGLISFTVPASWTKTTFRAIYPEHIGNYYYSDVPLYWLRYEVDLAVDSTTTATGITAANRSTRYAELLATQTMELKATYGFGGLGCVEALTNNGTANLIVNVAMAKEGMF